MAFTKRLFYLRSILKRLNFKNWQRYFFPVPKFEAFPTNPATPLSSGLVNGLVVHNILRVNLLLNEFSCLNVNKNQNKIMSTQEFVLTIILQKNWFKPHFSMHLNQGLKGLHVTSKKVRN
jgi:hypothetical protein